MTASHPELARDLLRDILGRDPGARLVDMAASTLAAFRGSEDQTGAAYEEALDLATGAGMSEHPADNRVAVEESRPLPDPPEGPDADADSRLRHVLRLVADASARRRLVEDEMVDAGAAGSTGRAGDGGGDRDAALDPDELDPGTIADTGDPAGTADAGSAGIMDTDGRDA